MSSEPPASDRPLPAGEGPAPGPAAGRSPGYLVEDLAEKVLSGDDPQMALLAARGLLPLPPETLIPLQVRLAAGADGELASAAAGSLRSLEPKVGVPFLRREAGEEVLGWFASHGRSPELLEAIIRRRDVPRRLLVELAPRLSPALQESLILRQDAIVEEPAILDALGENPDLTAYVRRRIGEYRKHLLPREKPAVEPPEPLDEVFPDDPSEEEVEAAIEEARRRPDKGEVDEEGTGLSEAQIRFLPVPVRLKLTRGAPRGLRSILIRDPNPLIARSVLRNNRFSESEIEQIAQNRNIDDKVLGEIATEREWLTKYRIVHALVKNPRTPVAQSVKLVPRLSVRDLRLLSRDRNVPEPVRSTAQRLYRIKRI